MTSDRFFQVCVNAMGHELVLPCRHCSSKGGMQCVFTLRSCNFCSTTLTRMRFAPVSWESTGTSAFHHDKVQNLLCYWPTRLDKDAHQPTYHLYDIQFGKDPRHRKTPVFFIVFHSHSCLRPLRLALLRFAVRSPHDACQTHCHKWCQGALDSAPQHKMTSA